MVRHIVLIGWYSIFLVFFLSMIMFLSTVMFIVLFLSFYPGRTETGQLGLPGLSGGAKVACILRHLGIQLILAYSRARPAILVAGKGRGGMFYFFCFFTFIPVPFSSLSLSFISSTIFFSLFFLSLGDNTKLPSRVDMSLSPNTINQLGLRSAQTNMLSATASDVVEIIVIQ